MALTRKQFDILEILATDNEPMTQRELEKLTGHSLGTVNKVLKELTELGFIEDGRINNNGINAGVGRCKWTYNNVGHDWAQGYGWLFYL